MRWRTVLVSSAMALAKKPRELLLHLMGVTSMASDHLSGGRRRQRARRRPALVAAAGLALGGGLLGFALDAKAELISISATGFTRHCPCVVESAQESDTHDGVLEITAQFSKFFAAVDFPADGQKVCSLSLVYRDVNANDAIRARLFKKTFSSGSQAFGSPVLMATAASASGTQTTVRITKTTSINQPTIAQANAFYYVVVDAPTINLAFLGVQIDVKSTC
jgi:hypothetical protein